MTYTPKEYIEAFDKKVSVKTIIRKCKAGLLPSNHFARKLPGRSGSWIIEIKN